MENPPLYKNCKPFLIVTKQNLVSAMLTTLILALLIFYFELSEDSDFTTKLVQNVFIMKRTYIAFAQCNLPSFVTYTKYSNATKVRKLICEESEN